jgi:tetratricopeptide (TPR) repeat protein
MSQVAGFFMLFALTLGHDQSAAPATPPGTLSADLDRTIAAAENSIKTGDSRLAERRYREALTTGWTVMGALALTEGREADARDAFDRAGRERGAPVLPMKSPALQTLTRAERRALARRITAALARGYFNLGVLLVQMERFVPAAERLEQAAALAPDFPRLQFSLGVAYFNAVRYDRALAPLRRALRDTPNDGEIRRMLALAAFNTGAYEEAATLLEADDERSKQPALQYAYGVALVRSDRAQEAERIFGDLLTEHADSAEVNVVLGLAQAQQGDLERATASLLRAVSIRPDVLEAHATLGTIYLKQGRLADAEASLRTELAAHPDNLRARQTLATVLDLRGQPEQALDVLQSLLAVTPDDANARYLRGKILLKQGAAAEAVVELERAVRLAPGDPNIHYQLGQAYQRTGRTDLATAQFDLFRQLKDERRAIPR